MPPKRRIPPNEVDTVPGSPSKRARFADSVIDNESKASGKKLMAAARRMDNNRASGSRANYDTAGAAAANGEAENGEGDDESASAQFADQVDSTLDIMGTSSKKKGKGRVKTEGYESDSTDDEEGVVYSRRKDKGGEGGGDEDEDMFNISEDKAEADEGKKKEVKYLKLGDIEGQEFDDEDEDEGGSRKGKGQEGMDDEDDISSTSSSEPEDEDDAIRRSKVGHGYDMTKFNMKEEMEEGKFAEDGTYVRSYDANEVHDRWLEGVKDKDMKAARRAKRRAERKEREREKQEAKELGIGGEGGPVIGGETTEGKDPKIAMEMQLVAFLRPGESVLEALARLGREKKRKDKKANKKKDEDYSSTGDSKPSAHKDTTDIDKLTALASALMVDDPDVYSTTYEALLRSVRRSGSVPEEWAPPVPKYEYRWAEGGGEGVFGPFTALEMQGWYDASFFGLGGEKIHVRKVGDTEWGDWDDVFV
jgi:CD2 antigen cytoplasmic tail-binding protein 2